MRLVVSGMLALRGAQIGMENIECAAGHLRAPLEHFIFFPVSVQPYGRIGEVLRKCLPVIAFAIEHISELPSRVHVVDRAARSAPAVRENKKNLACLAVIWAIKPGLGGISFGPRPAPGMRRLW